MSTRSIIAKKTDEGFIGTYHHWDGYPSGVGRFVAKGFQQGGWEYLNNILKHSWSSLHQNECYCCGTMADGRREKVYIYTHETNCWADFLYVFGHDKKKATDYMEIYQNKGEGEQWSIFLVIDLSLPLPFFEELEESLF